MFEKIAKFRLLRARRARERQPARCRPAGPSLAAAGLPVVVRPGAELPLGNRRSSRGQSTVGGGAADGGHIHTTVFVLSYDEPAAARVMQRSRPELDRAQSVAGTSLAGGNR